MRLGRTVLLSAPLLAVALLVVTSIAAADTPPPTAPGLKVDAQPLLRAPAPPAP